MPKVSGSPDIEVQAENILPPAPDIGSSDVLTQEPQANESELPHGEVFIPSNVIDGDFTYKQAVGRGGISSHNAEAKKSTPQSKWPRPGDTETVVYITHAKLHDFKRHSFKVRDDETVLALTENNSIRE